MYRELIKKFLDENEVSQARFAKTIGVNGAYLSKYMVEGSSYKYASKVEKPAKKYIDNSNTKQEEKQITNSFIKTTDVKNAWFVMDDAVSIGKMAVITGSPGSGKTRTIKEYTELRPQAILIEATIKTRGKELFEIIARKLGVKVVISQDVMVRECANELMRSERFFIIDEAEHLPFAALELLRRLHDFSGRAIILAGTEQLIDNLRGSSQTRKAREFRQLSSRIVGKYEFKGLVYKKEVNGVWVEKKEDLIAVCNSYGLSDDEAIKTIKLLTRGNMRKSENLIGRAKRLAQFSDISVDSEVIKEASSMVFLD
ncbi:MAG: AAA family ATPase [Campylobacteraceae bacterium]